MHLLYFRESIRNSRVEHECRYLAQFLMAICLNSLSYSQLTEEETLICWSAQILTKYLTFLSAHAVNAAIGKSR